MNSTKTRAINAPKTIKITNWVVISKIEPKVFHVFDNRTAARDFRTMEVNSNDFMAPKKYTGTIRLA